MSAVAPGAALAASACGGNLATVGDGGAGALPPELDASVDACGGPTPSPTCGPKDATPNAPDACGAPGRKCGTPDTGPDPRCKPVVLDGGSTCSQYVELPCGLPGHDGGDPSNLPAEVCKAICPQEGFSGGCVARPEPNAGWLKVECWTCVEGRRPAGYVARALTTMDLGSLFAHMTELEAASIVAFETMRDELAFHGAPRFLVRAAAESAGDERRHTREMGRIARRFGGEPQRPSLARTPPRSIEELALENAVEGCIRETYGALVAMWQATHASDVVVAAVMMRVAEEETRHAELSWEVAQWADARLSPSARARIALAREAAIETLRREAAQAIPEELVRVAGLPSGDDARRLVDELTAQLFLPARAA